MLADHLRATFLSLYLFDSYEGAQAQHLTMSMRELDVNLVQHLSEMLDQVDY